MLPLVPASFGDIVAAAGIARSIYKALSDSTGSSSEYQCLITELHSFEQALIMVEHAITVIPPSGRLAQDIAAETTTCLELLKTFLDRIKSYQKALGGGGKGASWRKIGWGLFKTDEVASFRQKLSQHKQNITVFLNGLMIIVAASYADETRQSLASTKEELLAIQKRLPRSIGYGDGNSVTVINAFGNPMTFPLEFCFSPDRLHDTLMSYFKGKCGERHVQGHKYSISTKDGNSLVQANNWGSVVKKGRVLVMSMILEKLAQEWEHQRNICPTCHVTDLGVIPDEGWFQCRRCERRFGSNETIQLKDPDGDDSVAEFRNIRVVLVKNVR
ncbi:hypothetical protein BYT27DRAFT_7089287 [Phlegmacium glaucopus]|nr:hypothetical protein BYT27DRAFT_7089287 [Phlegmacium glaucopus]